MNFKNKSLSLLLALLPYRHTLIYVPKAVKKGCKKSVSNYTSAAFYFAILFVFFPSLFSFYPWLLDVGCFDHQKERCAAIVGLSITNRSYWIYEEEKNEEYEEWMWSKVCVFLSYLEDYYFVKRNAFKFIFSNKLKIYFYKKKIWKQKTCAWQIYGKQ